MAHKRDEARPCREALLLCSKIVPVRALYLLPQHLQACLWLPDGVLPPLTDADDPHSGQRLASLYAAAASLNAL